eukprot:4374999-Heterocapsa_arctica.AAC.1
MAVDDLVSPGDQLVDHQHKFVLADLGLREVQEHDHQVKMTGLVPDAASSGTHFVARDLHCLDVLQLEDLLVQQSPCVL